jgi:hypothetical protein
MSITTVADITDIVETDLTDEAIQKVIDREEAWLASRVGDLTDFDEGLVTGGVVELVWITTTMRGLLTSERQGNSSAQTFQQPSAAAQLRELVVRRLKPLAAKTIRLRSSIEDDPWEATT